MTTTRERGILLDAAQIVALRAAKLGRHYTEAEFEDRVVARAYSMSRREGWVCLGTTVLDHDSYLREHVLLHCPDGEEPPVT